MEAECIILLDFNDFFVIINKKIKTNILKHSNKTKVKIFKGK